MRVYGYHSTGHNNEGKKLKFTHGGEAVEFSGCLISLHPFSNGITSSSAFGLIVLKLNTSNHANIPSLFNIFTKLLQQMFSKWKHTVRVLAASIAWLRAELFQHLILRIL